MTELMKLFDLQGKTCVITGAGGALCSAMAIGLGSVGVNVALLDIDEEAARRTAEKITGSGGEAAPFACDVLIKDQLLDCRSRILRMWENIDLLITGAGGNDPDGSTLDESIDPERILGSRNQNLFSLDPGGFGRVFDLNFIGTFLTIQTFAETMAAQKKGSIVTISSMSADTPLTKVPAYSAAKAAVSNFTRWLAVHLAPVGVRVNALAPGFFMTEQLRFLHVDQQSGELTERARKVISHTPMGRYGDPQDLLGAVVWLLSDAAKFVTGAVVPIDGGFSAYTI